MQDLVIPGEQSLLKNLGVPAIQRRLNGCGGDDDRRANRRQQRWRNWFRRGWLRKAYSSGKESGWE
jgi:hypothetical protein